jgi:hypothetical protein
MSAFGGKATLAFVVANSKIKIEDFRALFWARSLNRFFQRDPIAQAPRPF